MFEYHKIHTIFKRNEFGKLLIGEYSRPEFEYLKDNTWIMEEKIDGMNMRIIYESGKLRIGGKTDNAQIPTFLYDKINSLVTAEKLTEMFGDSQVCLCGEGFGAKIQKGGEKYIADGVDFILFDVWVDGLWLKREDVSDVACKLELRRVPVLGTVSLTNIIEHVRRGFSSTFGSFVAEGVILRPQSELFDRRGDRIITKLKHKDFKRA